MARTVDTLYDQTSGVGAALTTPVINTAPFESVVFWFIGGGAAAPTGCSVSPAAADATALGPVAVTVGIGGKSPAVLGAVPAAGVANSVALGPVTPKASATGTGGAASTVRIVVFGVRDGAPAN
ncbi:MAG TPA: hypothetical protein VFP50_18210 [Anaeromyxobacteraceae bacterium]|nr:hypothetical protein [Anaeromyxobacteraceae bacterium]